VTRGLRGVAVRARSSLGRAARGLRASPLPSAVATLTIAVTLLLAGTFALVVENMRGLLAHVGEEVGVTAYLSADLTPDGVESLAAQADQLPGVGDVRSVSREEAARRFAAQGEERAAWLEALGEDVLPASLEVSLRPEARTREGVRAVADALRALPGVADVAAQDEWAQGYARSVEFVRAVGVVLGVVLALATLVLVANTMRLAIYARRDEIAILSLVGASRSFIALPFLMEGALQGLAGGLVALGLLALGFRLVQGGLAAGLAFLLGSADPVFLTTGGAALLVSAGAALGIVGSALSLVAGWRS
jgi:cell division transport system permease protein